MLEKIEKIDKPKNGKKVRGQGRGIEPVVHAHKARPEPLKQRSSTRFAVKILLIL
jgi:hypothetical protein